MTWVKVCGLTREADVAAAVEAGADALGFVLAQDSPRCVSIERAATLMHAVATLRVLVTVDADQESIEAAVDQTGADGVQAHGRHATDVARWAARAGLFVLRPMQRTDDGGWHPTQTPEGQIPLLDSAHGGSHGGTGVQLDWTRLDVPERRFVLAGGLDPGNVATAIEIVNPWGVDASSGLESAPGIKDPARVAAFLQEAKQP